MPDQLQAKEAEATTFDFATSLKEAETSVQKYMTRHNGFDQNSLVGICLLVERSGKKLDLSNLDNQKILEAIAEKMQNGSGKKHKLPTSLDYHNLIETHSAAETDEVLDAITIRANGAMVPISFLRNETRQLTNKDSADIEKTLEDALANSSKHGELEEFLSCYMSPDDLQPYQARAILAVVKQKGSTEKLLEILAKEQCVSKMAATVSTDESAGLFKANMKKIRELVQRRNKISLYLVN